MERWYQVMLEMIPALQAVIDGSKMESLVLTAILMGNTSVSESQKASIVV